ncbi:MnhB domain-containing protein [Thermobrachium celere]|uniref:Na+/H+ antiporter MnhB subunit-related protein n=1 Tax=Thermobrachium celere DSM 8682 TaxID=941824 RepID=R7RRY9_9CLOT|nr:MnhB domain-containing protein [Thermobrachium celere]GFR36340.1 cation:proton antiporter [Thermobrachium celere]CDF58146.1 Na+/H+ antiporter MnhB subunit-related protein [Thermobrachium celere DSM 8682]
MSNKNVKVKEYIIKSAADFFAPIGLILGIYIILHGHLSPGGGFQGGVIVASAAVLIYLGYGYETATNTLKPNLLKKSEAIGALMYSFFALLGIFYAANFCRNVFYNVGNPGDLFSSGTIFLMNFAVGYKVLTGVGFLILLMFGLLANKEA